MDENDVQLQPNLLYIYFVLVKQRSSYEIFTSKKSVMFCLL